MGQFSKNYRTFSSKNSQKYGFEIRDPEKTYFGSRGQKGTGSRIRIRNTAGRDVWKKLLWLGCTKSLGFNTENPGYSFFMIFGFLGYIQHCFICRPSVFNVSEDAAIVIYIEPRTVATLALNTQLDSSPNMVKCDLLRPIACTMLEELWRFE